MSRLQRLREEPWANDLFATLREFERSQPGRPRLGEGASLDEDIVTIGQDPFFEFPASNIVAFEEDGPRPRLIARFLGFLGPQGVLPLTTTLEAYQWGRRGDTAYARFLEIFLTRFAHLFFRAWSNVRPGAQRDRPRQDRFCAYVGGFSGIETPEERDADLSDTYAKLGFSGLLAPRVKSAARLSRFLKAIFRAEVVVEERVGMWLDFEPEDCMRLGQSGSALGQDTMLGRRAYSINEKIRIAIQTSSLADYSALLPTGSEFARLNELVFFYIGHRYQYEVELALPAREAPPARLGRSGQLGWTAWIAPPAAEPDAVLRDARFSPPERPRAPASATFGRNTL